MSRQCIRRLHASSRRCRATAAALLEDYDEPVFSPKGKEPLRDAAELRSLVKARIARADAVEPFSNLPLSARAYLTRPPLRDTFARNHTYLRISLTERCNLRCTYCMPAEGVPLSPKQSILTDDEVVRLAQVFVRHGVDKIRLTGGEPTLRKGLPEIIERLGELDGLRKICMTSNGIALHRKLPDLVRRGLTHLNLSLDTLQSDRFEVVTRRRGHSAVLSSLDAALSLPLVVKLNTVLTRDFNLDELLSFVRLTRDRPLAVRFIEFMPFSGNSWDKERMVPYNEALALLRQEFGSDLVQLEAEDNDGTSKRWKIKGWAGEIGFISSMSDHFCGTCNRLRVTADGNLKVCLFDNQEVSLRDVLRHPATPAETDRLLTNVIGQAVGGKRAKHAGMDLLAGLLGAATYTGTMSRPQVRLTARHGQRRRLFARYSHSSSTRLTHLDDAGRASMVSIAEKRVTVRRAIAEGRIWLNRAAFDLLAAGKNPQKGDVLGTARIAGIMAGKRTSELIPLCHPIGLTDLKVRFALRGASSEGREGGWVYVQATAECEGKTGVEMEALTAASTSLLTVWDMIKAVAGKEMVIEGLRVTRKEGGKSGNWERPGRSDETLMWDL